MNLYFYILIISILAKIISLYLGKSIIKEKAKENFLAKEIDVLKSKYDSEEILNKKLGELYKNHNYLFFTKYILIGLNAIISLAIFYIVIDLTNILSFLNIEYIKTFIIFEDLTSNNFYIELFIIYILIYMFEVFISSNKNTKWFMYCIPLLSTYLIFFVLKFKIYIVLYFMTRSVLGLLILIYKKIKNKKEGTSTGN